MASSNNNNNASKKENGAAEEPDAELDTTSSSASPASYDPSDYKPHPDDRDGGGADGKEKGRATKPPGKAKVAAAPTDKAKGKDDGGHRCANCDKPGATKKCGRCGVEWYCNRNCQKVRGWWW